MKSYLKTKNGILYHGDCLDVMPYLAKKNIKFDLILTDPPYGTTACKWDFIIPFDKMWLNINNVINDNTPIVLFGNEPFASKLRLSNLKYFKYDWIWLKTLGTNFMNARKMPITKHEYICIFYEKLPMYNPQKHIGKKYTQKSYSNQRFKNESHGSVAPRMCYVNKTTRMPISYIKFSNPNNNKYHPTQKPVDLYKYLIKTYTKENDLILDFCAGSGTLGIACEELNRKYIMIEKEIKYCEVIKKRMIDNNINIISKKIKLRKRR